MLVSLNEFQLLEGFQISVYMSVCVCCVCMCVKEKERERERVAACACVMFVGMIGLVLKDGSTCPYSFITYVRITIDVCIEEQ